VSFSRIVTLTLNPTLDMEAEAPAVQPIHKIHTSAERVDPGGGGINAARMIRILGGDVLAVLLAGGSTGRDVEEELDRLAVPWLSVPIAHRTRMSLTVLDRSSGLEYRFVPKGPEVTPTEWQAVLDLLDRVPGDWLVASGSLPSGVPADAYAQVAAIAARRGQRFALDTSGEALAAALEVEAAGAGALPPIEVIKPSLRELEELAGQSLARRDEQITAARALIRRGGVRRVALTLGEAGALLIEADAVLSLAAPPEPVHSAVGAGDAFLAAFVLSLARNQSSPEALAWGVAAGGAAVAATGAKHVARGQVEARHARLVGSVVVLAG
jgi:6-phosphofructokinase 2